MKNEIAIAMALALAGIAGGLSLAPNVLAEHNNCHKSFDVADSEGLALERELEPGEIDVGEEAISEDEVMNVELTTPNDELEWSVYREDTNGTCVEYTASNCDGPNTLSTRGAVGTCDLKIADDDVFYLLVENVEPSTGDELEFKAWAD